MADVKLEIGGMYGGGVYKYGDSNVNLVKGAKFNSGQFGEFIWDSAGNINISTSGGMNKAYIEGGGKKGNATAALKFAENMGFKFRDPFNLKVVSGTI